MKILVAHNFYQQPGGEDQVFASEVALLRRYGNDPLRFVLHNDDVDGMKTVNLLGATVWNHRAYAELRRLLHEERPDVVHFHNTFPLISPAAYSAARAEGAAVVQTLHNFRLLCPSALFFRDGHVCEECLGKFIPWPGVVHGCYRGSRTATAAVAVSLTVHRALGTWEDAVDIYIAPTESARLKFIQGGLPEAKLVVKPNFLDPDPGVGEGKGGYAVFVARLSHEKGLETLLAAWEQLGSALPLKIIGDGPLADRVREVCLRCRSIEWLGRKPSDEVYEIIGNAECLIFPSQCYETFGRVAAEAFAKGTPVIASRLGAMADLVEHGRTGLLFEAGNPVDLALQVRRLLSNDAARAAMRVEARREFEAKYTGHTNFEKLMGIYRKAMEHSAAAPPQRKLAASV